jgi:16S rRNA (uracil1498-N3)-methyltransferase
VAALSPPVFLAAPSALRADTVVLSGAEGRHAATVRRIRPGERVDVTDGAGQVAECVVTAATPGRLELRVEGRRAEPRPEPAIVVVQAIPKGARGELAVEMMTEVGVDVIAPWAASRSIPTWQGARGDKALARWRDTAREAAKQARRAWIPDVLPPAETAGVAGMIQRAARAVVLEPDASLRLADVKMPTSGSVVVVAGPEGGISAAESAAFGAAGAVSARLGPSVLRASTAGAVAAALLLSGTDRW